MENFDLTSFLLGVLVPITGLFLYGLIVHAIGVWSNRFWMKRIEKVLEELGDEKTLKAFRKAGKRKTKQE